MDIVETTRAAMIEAARKSGVNVDGLSVEICTMDRTWGDSVGMFFSGDNALRAAKWFAAWAYKHLRIDACANRSGGEPEEFQRVVCRSNGVTGHYRHKDNRGEAYDVVNGYAVKFAYYPCGE